MACGHPLTDIWTNSLRSHFWFSICIPFLSKLKAFDWPKHFVPQRNIYFSSDASSACVYLVRRFRVPSPFYLSVCVNLTIPGPMAFGHWLLSLWAFTGYHWFVLAFPQLVRLSFHALGVPKMGSPFFCDDFGRLGVFSHACVRFLASIFLFFSGKLPFVGPVARAVFTV